MGQRVGMLQIGVLEDLLVELRCGVGVIHLSGGRGGEHILVVRRPSERHRREDGQQYARPL